jgi:hypothetical protein
MVIVDILRIASTTVGAIVILMWLGGAFGLAEFALIFRVQ